MNNTDKLITSIPSECINDKWRVTEKINGANFSYYCDGKIIKYAKRTNFLDDNTDFFNYKYCVQKYNDMVMKLFHYMKKYDTIKQDFTHY